jgi:hypothetical protein
MAYYRPPGLTIDTQQIRRSSCRPGWRSWYQGQLYGGSCTGAAVQGQLSALGRPITGGALPGLGGRESLLIPAATAAAPRRQTGDQREACAERF